MANGTVVFVMFGGVQRMVLSTQDIRDSKKSIVRTEPQQN
jgi:hypothetical protein